MADPQVPAWASTPVTAPPAWAAQDVPTATTGQEQPVPADEPRVDYPLAKGALQALGTAGGAVLASPGDVAAGPLATMGGGALGYMFGTGMYNALQNIKDYLDPKGAKGPPVSLAQDTIDMIKGGALALGGQAGMEAGAATELGGAALSKLPLLKGINPAIANRIIGGGVGTATGSLTGDQAQQVAKLWAGIPLDQRTPGLLGQLQDAAFNGLFDMAFGTAVSGGPGMLRQMGRKAWGLTDDALNLFKTAQKAGIPLNIANVSEGELARGYLKIVNMVPALSHPYSHAALEQENAVNSRLKEITEGIANGPVPTAPEIGTMSMTAASKNFGAITDQFNTEYDKLLAEARVAGPIVPTTGKPTDAIPSIQQVGLNYLKTIKQSTMPQMETPPTGGLGFVRAGRVSENISIDKQAVNFAQRLTNLPKVITVDQADGMLRELDTLYARAQKSGTDIYALSQLRGSVRNALDHSTDGQLGAAFNNLDTRWSNMRDIFQTTAGQKFNLAQRNAFSIALSRPGVRTEDSLGQLLYKMNSPDQVEQLRSIVGDDMLHKGAARFVEEAAVSASQGVGMQTSFDAAKFAQNLGLNDEKGMRWQAVQAALSGSDITPQMLKDFAHAAAATQAVDVTPTSTMLARRLVLGGAASLAHAVFPLLGAEMEGGGGATVGTAAGLISAWRLADVVSNPKVLVNLTKAMDNSVPDFERRMSLVRAARFLFSGSSETRQGVSEAAKRGVGLVTGASSSPSDSSFLQRQQPPQVPNTP